MASTRLLSLPSCMPSVSIAAARPSESVVTVVVVGPLKLPPPPLTLNVTGMPPSRLLPVSMTTAINGFGKD